MKDELGLGYCGLVCGLCSENESCVGCKKGGCPEKDFCKNYQCCTKSGYDSCCQCPDFPCQDYTSYGLEHFVNLLDNMGKKN